MFGTAEPKLGSNIRHEPNCILTLIDVNTFNFNAFVYRTKSVLKIIFRYFYREKNYFKQILKTTFVHEYKRKFVAVHTKYQIWSTFNI